MLGSKPKNDGRYIWTNHIVGKMAHYKISPSFVKRIVRFPERTEEGIATDTAAAMKRAETGKNKSEVWTMYQIYKGQGGSKPRIKLITAWRYPGTSPARDPIPPEILEEIKEIL